MSHPNSAGNHGFGPPPHTPPPPHQPPPTPSVSYGAQQHTHHPQSFSHVSPYGPPPPKKGNAGKVLAIVAACVVGLGVIAFAFSVLNRVTERASQPKYTLSFPKTLENGKFRLTRDLSELSKKVPNLEAGDKSYMGMYTATSGDEQILYNALNSTSLKGGSKNGSHHRLLNGMRQNPNVDAALPRREITPSNGQEPVTCEVLTKSSNTEKLTLVTCAWGNNGSAAAVSDNSPNTLATPPEDVDLDAFAERVNTIRDEVRSKSQ